MRAAAPESGIRMILRLRATDLVEHPVRPGVLVEWGSRPDMFDDGPGHAMGPKE